MLHNFGLFEEIISAYCMLFSMAEAHINFLGASSQIILG